MAKAMIITVGAQGEQIIFSLKEIKPNYLGLIYTNTKESKDTVNMVMEKYPLPAAQCRSVDVEDNPKEIGNIINKFKEIYDWIKKQGIDDKDIIVDPTGGRKWMSSGATMIASFLGLNMIYVDVQFKDVTVGQITKRMPDPTTMKIISMGNAYDKTAFLEEEKIDTLFNAYEYSTAIQLYDKLAEKVETPRLYEIKKYISQAYLYWSQFFFSSAYENLKKATSMSENFGLMREKLKILKQQTEILKILSDEDNYYSLLKKPEFCKSILLTLLSFSIREAESKRYNTAVIGLYRILELIAQIRLAQKNIDTNDIRDDVRKEYEAKFKEIAKKILGAERGITNKIGLLDSWILLFSIGDEIIKEEKGIRPLKDMMGATEPRNLIWLEHGNKIISEREYENFKRYVERWIAKIIPDYTKEIEPYLFIKL